MAQAHGRAKRAAKPHSQYFKQSSLPAQRFLPERQRSRARVSHAGGTWQAERSEVGPRQMAPAAPEPTWLRLMAERSEQRSHIPSTSNNQRPNAFYPSVSSRARVSHGKAERSEVEPAFPTRAAPEPASEHEAIPSTSNNQRPLGRILPTQRLLPPGKAHGHCQYFK